MVNALQNENIEDMWPEASTELSNLVNGVHRYSPTPVASRPNQTEQYLQKQIQVQETLEAETKAEKNDVDEDPLADMCTLLQAAGDRGVDLNRWLTHYDKTGTGVLKRKDLHRAITSLGLGVSVGESEYDEQTAERALAQDSFDKLVEYLGVPSNSDIIPYARLLTMVPSLMETRRGDIRGNAQNSPMNNFRSSQRNDGSPKRDNTNATEDMASSPGGLAWTLKKSQIVNQQQQPINRLVRKRKSPKDLTISKSADSSPNGGSNIPLDVAAVIGQNRARERVRERIKMEKMKLKMKEKEKLLINERKQKICDTVSLTNKMKKVTQKRRKKKKDKAAREAQKSFEISNATNLEDLIRSRIASR
jgi:hypothetical protein